MAKSTPAVVDNPDAGKSADEIAAEFTDDDDLGEEVETTSEAVETDDEVEQVEGESEAVETEEAPTAEVETPKSWLEQLREDGISLNARDEAAARAELRQIHTNYLPQLQQQARFAQQVAPKWEAFQKWEAEQAAVQQQTKAEPDEWTPPEYLPEWEAMLIKDEEGNITGVKPGGAFDLPQKAIARQRFEQKVGKSFVSDPRGTIRTLMADEMKNVARQASADALAEYQQQQLVKQIVQQDTKDIYVLDGNGNIQVDAVSGQPVFSQYGQNFQAVLSTVPQNWNNPAYQRELARYAAIGMQQVAAQQQGGAVAKPAAAQAPPPKKPAQQASKTQRSAAVKRAGRAGTTVQPTNPNRAAPQNGFMRPAEFFRQEWQDLPDNFALANEE